MKEKISKYTKSNEVEDRLIGFNLILAIGILAFIFPGYLTHGNSDFLTKIIILLVCILFAAVAGLIYLPIIEFMSDIVEKDVFSLKFSIALLICAFNLTFFGFYLDNLSFLKYGFVILIIQIVVMIIIGYLKIPVTEKVQQKADKSVDIWVVLDKISIITGLINFIVWIFGLYLSTPK